MFKWAMLSLCVFAGVNWFILPNFPEARQYIPVVSIWGAIGLSAILMVLSMVFGKGK